MTSAALVALLQSAVTISAQLAQSVTGPTPRGPAVYKQVLPRGYKLPAIAIHRYDGTSDQSMAGPTGLREDNFQLDLYGDTQEDCDAITDAARAYLTGLTGTLSDGSVVQGVYLEQDRDMPFLPNADTKSLAFRALLGFRFVNATTTVPAQQVVFSPGNPSDTVDEGQF